MKQQLIIFIFAFIAVSCGNKPLDSNNSSKILTDTISTISDSSKQEEKSIFVLDLLNSMDTSGIVDTNAIIKTVLYQTNNFDNSSQSFRKDTFEFFEKTTEGGDAIVIHDKTSDIISIQGKVFGEMGKTEYKFYLTKQMKFLCAIFKEISYDKPMYEQGMKIKSTESVIQIFKNGITIAVLNDKKKKLKFDSKALENKDLETKEFFAIYIGQIKINK